MTRCPSKTDPYDPPAGLIPLTPTPHDAGTQGVSPVIESTIPECSFTIPAGSYAVVYFQAKLAMTLKWMPLQGSYGAGGYPGSSGQGYLLMAGGKKTVPLPSVTVPGGDISVYKFYDTDQDGVKDVDETQFLSGWDIHLSDGTLIDTKTTDADGRAFFDYLPPGTYYVDETLKDGWESNTSQPITVVIAKGESKTVHIGNFELLPDIELDKSGTFEDENADGIAQVGETITYTFKVENTGNVMLYDVMVSDPLVTVSAAPSHPLRSVPMTTRRSRRPIRSPKTTSTPAMSTTWPPSMRRTRPARRSATLTTRRSCSVRGPLSS
jgi:hypothetical protein